MASVQHLGTDVVMKQVSSVSMSKHVWHTGSATVSSWPNFAILSRPPARQEYEIDGIKRSDKVIIQSCCAIGHQRCENPVFLPAIFAGSLNEFLGLHRDHRAAQSGQHDPPFNCHIRPQPLGEWIATWA
jgi:hypothetical protein